MKSVLSLVVSLFLGLSLAKCDPIDDIVKNAITQAAPANAKLMPKIVETSDKCACGDKCTCKDCQCEPGKPCKCPNCKVSKSGSESLVERCFVIIDDVKIFTIEGVTPTDAMASIKAQGSKVVFINLNNMVVDPPSWYTGKVATSASMVRAKYSSPSYVASPSYAASPQYTSPSYAASPQYSGFQAGFGFSGPFGGNYSAGVCVGST